MPKNSLTLIKLGGSIITNKDIPMSLRADVLKRLVKEISEAYQELPNQTYIVGHGQGSFAHVPAHEYKTMDGFINDDSPFGMAVTQDSAAQLNRIVVHEFIRHHIPAVSFSPSNTLITKKRKTDHFCTQILDEYLEKGLMPITGGDVIVDRAQGCTIWSTEEVLSEIAQQFHKKGHDIRQIIHVTEVPGFLDHTGEVVREITPASWKSYKSAVTRTKGFDVTGGMALKIEESLTLAKIGIESKIISGLEKNNLYNALTGKVWEGTRIAKNKLEKQEVESYPKISAYAAR